MVDMRSQNKRVIDCPKRSKRVADCLAGRWWLVLSPNDRERGGLVGWPKDRGWLLTPKKKKKN